MDQIAIGNFLTKKRKEKNMTQAVFSVIEPLCKELGITVAELLDGCYVFERRCRMER